MAKVKVRQKIITVEPQARRELMALHGVSESSVWNALAWRSFSETAERIRLDALHRFGGIVQHKWVYKNAI